MNDASLYAKSNNFHMLNTNDILKNHLHLANIQDYANILDVGAGDRGVSLKVLLPKLPENFKEFVISDISDSMVKYAAKNYKNKKIKTIQLDIASTAIPANLIQYFDHVFSFTCLNWVEEKRQIQAFENIYNMLKPGGSTFITIIGKTPAYDIYENLNRSAKWKLFTNNFRKYTSVYHYSENPAEKLDNFLKTVGFDVRLCKVENRDYIFSSWQDFLNFAKSVNPFIASIPKNEQDNYIRDLRRESEKHHMITTKVCDGTENIYQAYKLLTACAFKPAANLT